MKKFLVVIFAALLLLISSVFATTMATTFSSALVIDTSNARTIAYSYLQDFVGYGGFPKTTVDRRAGTLGEAYACSWIDSQLAISLATNVEPKNNITTVDGLQQFSYFDQEEGKNKTSCNVIYKIAGASSQKKVVLTTTYDNDFAGYVGQDDQIIVYGEAYSEGINASAAGVAVLLAIAEIVPEGVLPFDIELVFFGAGYKDNAGARYYTQTLSKEDKESIILLADISEIALGEEVYFYSGEFGSKHDQFYSNTLGLKKFKTGFAGASVDAETPLLYENPGYSGSTVVFSDLGYNILHIFAGSYDQGVFGGKCEYYGKANIKNTENDSIDYIIAEHQTDLLENMGRAVQGFVNMLSADALQELSSADSTHYYEIFSNHQIVPYITAIVLIVLLIVAICVHYGISSKTANFAKDNDISAVVIEFDDEDNDKK